MTPVRNRRCSHERSVFPQDGARDVEISIGEGSSRRGCSAWRRSPSTGSGARAGRPSTPALTDPLVSALAIDPSAPATLYAGTASGFSPGVFKSINGGASWTAIGPTTSYVNALAIDPSAPATLYAGTGEGVFKSTNSGGSWTAISTGV
jgi:hypothetical protein